MTLQDIMAKMVEPMYYILLPHLILVGYFKLPYGICNLKSGKTTFYNKRQYDLVMKCDGKHQIEEALLDSDDQKLLHYLIDKGIIAASELPTEMKPYQEYVYYDNRYKNDVQWSITGRCNYRCRHCFMSAPDSKSYEPTFDQCRKIVEGLAASGVKTVGLTGGEPLVRDDIIDIIDLLLRNGVFISTIYTNGALLNRTFMEALKVRGLRPVFQLSFDGVGCHDWMRGIDGAENDVIDAFRLIKEYNCTFGVSMALHKHNVEKISETIRFLSDMDCSYIKINIAEPCGSWASQTEHFLSLEDMFSAFLDYIPHFVYDGNPISIMLGGTFCYEKEEKRFSIPYDKSLCTEFERMPVCSCIRSGAYISPEGILLPCMSMVSGRIADEFPNAFETPLPELLHSSHYSDMMSLNVNDYLEHNPKCASCKYSRMCRGGCRAIAVEGENNDFLGIDEEACAFFCGDWYDKFLNYVNEYNNISC